jgi:butyryl-CoA dehydrogenase
MILVPRDAPGMTITPIPTLGGEETNEIHLDGVRVPEDALLGERGRGYPQCLSVLTDGRISVAALAVGCAQACLDLAVRYAKERETFGRPIGANQAIQSKLADMQAATEASRLLTYRAAWLKDQGRAHTAEASMAKLVASTAAVDCAREAVQIHGGAGFMEESPVARFYRDAKVLEIGEGTSEIQRLILARELGLPDAIA